MPLPILAHQAPVLPLKLWRPRAWNGTALVVGSIAPDVSYLRMAPAASGFSHTVAGQFCFCLPVTLVLVGLFGFFDLAGVLLARLPEPPRTRLAWMAGAGGDVTRPGGFLRACTGALVGSFSHIGLDLLTHKVIPERLPMVRVIVGTVLFTTPTLVQLAVSGLGVVASLVCLLRIARLGAQQPPAKRSGLPLVVILGAAGFIVGARLAKPAVANPDLYFAAGRFYVWGDVAFLVACGSGAGVILAGLLLRAWDRAPVAAVP